MTGLHFSFIEILQNRLQWHTKVKFLTGVAIVNKGPSASNNQFADVIFEITQMIS